MARSYSTVLSSLPTLSVLAALTFAASFNPASAQSASDVTAGRNPLSLVQNGCPAEQPLYCTTTDCCPSDTPYFCNSLTRNHPQGAASAGWSGCVRPATDESFKWWSDACQPIWVQCY